MVMGWKTVCDGAADSHIAFALLSEFADINSASSPIGVGAAAAQSRNFQ
jgi:hypothetical protein